MVTIGERIKYIRKENKLTQVEFGTQLGISQAHVSKLEKDVENPSKTLLLFASYRYSIDLEWLENGVGIPTLTLGSSEEGTTNYYHVARYNFEKELATMNTSDMWYYVQAFYYFSAAIQYPETYDNKRQEFHKLIEEFEHILFFIVVATKEIFKKGRPPSDEELEKNMRICSKQIERLPIIAHQIVDFLRTDEIDDYYYFEM